MNREIPANVFILASGSSKRMGGIVKQLLPVGGEPIIRRTIRLIRQFDPAIKIHIITWRDELKFDDVITIDTVTPTVQLTDTILISRSYWGSYNIFLVGDAIFGEDILNKVLSCRESMTMFYRDTCPTKPDAERFAFCFSRECFKMVVDLCGKSSRIFRDTNMEPCCGFVKICYATGKYEWLIKFTAPVLYTDGTHRYLNYIRAIRDLFIFNVYYPWKPRRFISLQSADDNITTDIDTSKDYEMFLALGVI